MLVGIIGGVAGLVAIVVSILAERRARRAEKRSIQADERSDRAEKQAELSKMDALWGDMIRATHPFIGANVVDTDMRTIVLQFRTAGTDLMDGLPQEQQQSVSEWLEAERLLLSALTDYTTMKLPNRHYTVDEAVHAHEDLTQVAGALINNLRLLRKTGVHTDTTKSVEDLTRTATENREEVKRRMADA